MKTIKNKILRKSAAILVAVPVWLLLMWPIYVIATYSIVGALTALILLIMIDRAIQAIINRPKLNKTKNMSFKEWERKYYNQKTLRNKEL